MHCIPALYELICRRRRLLVLLDDESQVCRWLSVSHGQAHLWCAPWYVGILNLNLYSRLPGCNSRLTQVLKPSGWRSSSDDAVPTQLWTV